MKVLHDEQIEITKEMVEILITEQFPEYKNLPISEFDSTGTVNSIFRLGDDYCIRLPILESYAASILRESKILPYLSKNLTIKIPQPIELGNPNSLYPFHWAIYNWIDGDCYDEKQITDKQVIVSELATFIKELQVIGLLENAPRAGRGPLAELNLMTIDALTQSKDEIDYKMATKIWRRLINTTSWNQKPVWIHADLLKPNILTKENHISGIIDFGSAGIGDPAFDIIPAWTVFDANNRMLFREELGICDEVWDRACAYAFHQAALIIPYYRESNPSFVKQAINTINEIIIDEKGYR